MALKGCSELVDRRKGGGSYRLLWFGRVHTTKGSFVPSNFVSAESGRRPISSDWGEFGASFILLCVAHEIRVREAQ